MKKIVIFLLLTSAFFFTCDVFADENFSPNRINKLHITCDKDGCDTYACLKGKKKEILLDYPFSPTLKWLSDNFVEVTFKCGSPCSNSFFVDFKHLRISMPFELTLGANERLSIVAVAKPNHVEILPIFSNQGFAPIKIQREFSPSVSTYTVIEELNIRDDGTVFMKYQKGRDYEPKEEEITIIGNRKLFKQN